MLWKAFVANMNKRTIIFSPRAVQRMEEIADYLYQQQLSNAFVRDYMNRFEIWLEMVLGQFLDSGRLMPEYGKNIRRIVYQEYSFIYQKNENNIEILTVYRKNKT